MLAVTNFFAASNYLEACLWIVIAGIVVCRARRSNLRWPAAVTLVAFGCSDIVEAQSGAWWRPWWLLVWKGVCVLVLITLVAMAHREKRLASQNSLKR